MHGSPFAELVRSLPVADLWQCNAMLLPSTSFAVALGTAARQDNGHIVSMAASLALALRAGRSTLAVAGVFGAGKTGSLTFLLAWLALTTHLKIAVVHKENPAGRALTKLLTAFDLEPDHQRYCGLVATMALQRTHLLCHSCLAQANQAPTWQCRPPKIAMRLTSSWLP